MTSAQRAVETGATGATGALGATGNSPARVSVARPAYSIAVMCYNEEGSLTEMVERTVRVLHELGKPFEILIIDDGSVDSSPRIAEALAEKHAEVRVLRHPTNVGIGQVLIDGYTKTSGEMTAILPADLQFAPEDLPRAFAALENHDVVNIGRPDRRDPAKRKALSWVDETLVFLMFGVRLKDIHWVKVYRRELLEKICRDIRSTTPMVDTELLIKSHRAKARLLQIDLPHHPRRSGVSTAASLRGIVKTFSDLIRLRLALKRR